MYSIRFTTFSLASFTFCFIKTTPNSLKTLQSSLSFSNSRCTS